MSSLLSLPVSAWKALRSCMLSCALPAQIGSRAGYDWENKWWEAKYNRSIETVEEVLPCAVVVCCLLRCQDVGCLELLCAITSVVLLCIHKLCHRLGPASCFGDPTRER